VIGGTHLSEADSADCDRHSLPGHLGRGDHKSIATGLIRHRAEAETPDPDARADDGRAGVACNGTADHDWLLCRGRSADQRGNCDGDPKRTKVSHVPSCGKDKLSGPTWGAEYAYLANLGAGDARVNNV
jgi:hypothetical protein